MTLPTERTRAIINTYDIAREITAIRLGKSGEGVVIPRRLLNALDAALRHYPTELELRHAAISAPHIFGELGK